MAVRGAGRAAQVDHHLDALSLPPEMAARAPMHSQRVRALIKTFEEQRSRRNSLPALLIAMLALTEEVLADEDADSNPGGIDAYEREERNARGQHVNTLNVTTKAARKVRLRPLYNNVQHVIVHNLRRYDFPNMPGHATQAWSQHKDILDSLFSMSPRERRAVLDHAWAIVVDLPEFVPRVASEASPRPFSLILTNFLNTKPGEPAGAVLQGLAFAYYRADSPNVTIETGKVGAGSRRVGRVGDIDGWSGSELVLSIEVKDIVLSESAVPSLDGFIANLSEWPDAMAIVLAREVAPSVKADLEAQHVAALTREGMLQAVKHWDLNKQHLAAREFQYYLARVQRNSALVKRFETFLETEGIDL